MTQVRAAADAEPGAWLLRSGVDWRDLVRCGPPGFAAYVRVRLSGRPPEQEDPEQEVGDGPRLALTTLVEHTTRPDEAYVAVWDGWTGGDPLPVAPRLEIPERLMLLFTCPVASATHAPGAAWGTGADSFQEPNLVWPADRSWCLACEVDEDIELTVGCTEAAARELARAMPGAVRRIAYGDPGPLYRDDA